MRGTASAWHVLLGSLTLTALIVPAAPLSAQPPPTPSAAPAPAPGPRLTIDDVVALALRANPALRAKGFELRATQAGEITAGLRPNPVGTVLAEQLGNRATDPGQYTVNVGQPIETGGKRRRRLESARAATRVTSWELADVRRQVTYQAKKAFNDALVAQATVALARQNLATIDDVLRVQRYRAERGDISELELSRIQLQRFAFERDLADAEQALRAAKIALRAVAGAEAIPEDFDIAGALEYRDVPATREALLRVALANRPDLRAAEAAREKARADVNLARANAWWDVTPQLEYQHIPGAGDTVGVGVSIPIRLFDRNQGEIARTQAEVKRADALRDAAYVEALAEVDTAYAALRSERGKAQALRDTYLPRAQQARDTVEYAYRRGGLSLLDFLDAQRTYRETSLEYLRALGNYWTAVYRLESAVGGSWGNP
jgi:cobalt-zinc-cadmium efflux system outer membrane protein